MIGTLSLYDFKIVMIAGGADKKVPFDELGGVICDKVKTLVLLSPEKPLPGFKPAAAGKIEAAVRGAANYRAGAPEILHAHTMEEAVALAKSRAVPGDVVSLCPAATGFARRHLPRGRAGALTRAAAAPPGRPGMHAGGFWTHNLETYRNFKEILRTRRLSVAE